MNDKNLMNASEAVLDEMERKKWRRIGFNLLRDWRLYTLLVPMLLFVFLFKYLPISGILFGFRYGDTGKLADEWSGLFFAKKLLTTTFANGANFWSAFRNTFVNSMYGLLFGFPIPIMLALLFSEVKSAGYRSFLQVCAYLPHFISTVVVTSIISLWCLAGSDDGNKPGLLYQLFINLGWAEASNGGSLLSTARLFRPIYQISGVWEGAGYGSIVYFAAVMAISPTNYEAAKIDGASKAQQIKFVTLPGMMSTLTIMLIMRIGSILNIGYEKVILLIGDKTQAWETGDVISSMVYRFTGLATDNAETGNQQVGVVADLFNALIAMCLVLGANAISRRVSDTSLF